MTINELRLRPVFPNEIELLDAEFVQYCNDASVPLRGHLHFETPPDTTPPVIYLPTDLTVEAQGPSGATVSYGVSAVDDRDGYLDVTCTPASGALFPIGMSAVTCSAVDRAGNEARGQFNVRVDPPFQLGVDLGAFGSAARKSGPATVQGTVSCDRAATIYLTVSVTQLVARRASIQGSTQVAVECVAPSMTWSAEVSGANGAFLPGKATVDVEAFTCPYYCHSASASRVVTLRAR
jgi:hypothetical protein